MDSGTNGRINMNSRLVTLCEGAIMVAMALGLSYIKFRLFTTGGSVDAVMLPLMVFALRRGAGWGVGAGVIFGTLKYFLAGGVAYTWQAMLMDYTVAYAAVGLAGFFSGTPVIGVTIGAIARYIMHILSGVVLWGEYMPDVFLGLTMTNTFVYSILYNATYMVPSYIIALVIIIPLSRAPRILKV